MKLFITPTSPYARIVRIALLETGLGARTQVLAVPTRVAQCPVNALNPTGKVPTLATDDGLYLSETRLILQYLDGLHAGSPLVDPDPTPRSRMLEGVVTGFLDGIAVWIRELKRPPAERSPGILDQEQARMTRCLDWLEERAQWLQQRADFLHLSLFAALSTIDERIRVDRWQQSRPRLGRWYAAFAARDAVRATRPPV